jgi:hypothetical protein
MKYLKSYKIFEDYAEDAKKIEEFVKNEVVNMDLLYDIKDASLEYLDPDANLYLDIIAYIKVEKAGKINNVDFLDMNFTRSRNFEDCFHIAMPIKGMFANKVDMIIDALSGEFKLHPNLKFLGIGYKIAIIDATYEEEWFDIQDEKASMLKEETDNVIKRIRGMYPDEKIDIKF